MAEPVLVRVGDTEFYAEVSGAGSKVATAGLDDVLSFDGVRDTISAIAREIATVWREVKPTEANVEFGLKLSAKSGKLTGLLVEGGGEATVTVALKWLPTPTTP